MDDFSITCTTCKSRLKVRDQAVIGQILACPKCGGMVLVKPPAEQQPAGVAEQPPAVTSTVDVNSLRETIGDSTFNDVDDLLSDAPPRANTPIQSLSPGVPTKLVRSTEAAPLPPPIPAEPIPATGEQAVEPPPPTDWSGDRPWRYWALLAGSLLAGIVLAVAVVVVSIRVLRDDPTTPVAEVPEQPVVPEVPPAPAVVAPEPDERPQATDDPQPDEPPTPAAPAVENDPAKSATNNMAESPAPQANVPTKDPLGLTNDPPPAVAESPAQPPAMNDPLGKFGALLEGASDNPLPTVETPTEPLKVPAEGTADASDPKSERTPLPRPPAQEISVTARLADPLPAIELDGVPLADFLQVMSDLSTVPITLHPDSLWFVKSAPSAPITYRGTNTTVGAALRDALAPIGLEATVVDGQVIVDLAHANPPRSINFPTQDLAEGDDQQSAQLAEWITALVSPDSWGEGEGRGQITANKDSLAIAQQSPVHAELLMMCEKLRVARGIKPLTASRYDVSRFKLEPRFARAAGQLSTPITLNFNQPTLLVKIVERLGAAGKLRILIDWQSLSETGWTTETEGTLLADKLPLDEALTRLLEPMDLAWRVVDENTLQVLSQQALANKVELEFYKLDGLVADPAGGDALVNRITSAMGEDVFSDGGGLGEIRYDVAGNCLLVAFSQPEQQSLAKLLAAWRDAKQPFPAAAALGNAR